ncbi:MAG: HNH endonuclease [Candidatus Marinimicrobia bacterium]|nr:HNH endonuclease [Candidatus Neomarinimicrobiota bacterium]
MAISKKIRFEVFKRDGFQCAYCGRKPPAVILECDHINPKSKGGSNDINNLITACFDCNRGKSNNLLTNAPIKMSENIKIMKEKQEQFDEYCKFLKIVEKKVNSRIDEVVKFYESLNNEHKLTFTDTFKQITLRKFVKALPVSEIKEAMVITHTKLGCATLNNDRWGKYFCGICWTKIRKINNGDLNNE